MLLAESSLPCLCLKSKRGYRILQYKIVGFSIYLCMYNVKPTCLPLVEGCVHCFFTHFQKDNRCQRETGIIFVRKVALSFQCVGQ